MTSNNDTTRRRGGRPKRAEALQRLRDFAAQKELEAKAAQHKLAAEEARLQAYRARGRRKEWLTLGEIAKEALGLDQPALLAILESFGGPGDHRAALLARLGISLPPPDPSDEDA